MNKKLLRDILPPFLIRFLSGLKYGWHGNYATWEEAKKKCTGYSSRLILDKVKVSTLMVMEGKAAYERDSMRFEEADYSYPLMSALMWVAAQNKSKLNVLDFGGSLGSSYFQNKLFLDTITDLNWCIVEQTDFVSAGKELSLSDRLHFFYSVDECLETYKIDVVLLSSVLQYIEKPFDLLEKIKNLNCKYLIIDRTPFINGRDRITVQKVNPLIYTASYPCWFFNREKFLSLLNFSYKRIFEFEALDKANIPSEFRGFLFQKYE